MVKNILHKHWGTLLLDPDLSKHIEPHPSITFRRGRNLKDRLTNSHFVPPQPAGNWLSRQPLGNFKCSGCIACPFIKSGRMFTSLVTNQTYNIYNFVNCRSMKLVYLISCTCGMQYVGKTGREFRRRIGEHLGDVRNHRDTAVSRHLWQQHGGDISNIRFQGIERIQPSIRGGDTDRRILQREAFWIFTLQTSTPHGLNDQLNFPMSLF